MLPSARVVAELAEPVDVSPGPVDELDDVPPVDSAVGSLVPLVVPPVELSLASAPSAGSVKHPRLSSTTNKEQRRTRATAYRSDRRTQTWLVDSGASPGGAPWEVYLTDPGEVPDPADWKTQVLLPIGS